MAVKIGSLFVSLTADVRPFVENMGRADSRTVRATQSIARSAGVAERSVNSFWNSAGARSFRPYSLIAVSRAFDNAADRAGLLRGALLATTAVFGGFTAALSSNIILRYADSYTKLNNQVRVVSDNSEDAAARFSAIQAVANRSRSSLEATAILYSRIQKASPDRSADEILRYVETIQKALVLGGSTAQEARSAAIQFSQAIASNRLGGEELRAVLETPLGLELARGLGITIGKLREMSIAGELTADVVLAALKNVQQSVDQQFNRSIRTVDQALIYVDNRLTEYIGGVDKAYGATALLTRGIVAFGDNLDSIVPTIGLIAGGLAAAFTGRLISRTGGNFIRSIADDAKQARERLMDLRQNVSGLRSQIVDAELRRSSTARAAFGDTSVFADTGAQKALERAQFQESKLAKQHEELLKRRVQAHLDLANVTATTSPKMVRLTQDIIDAETRLGQLNSQLMQQRQNPALRFGFDEGNRAAYKEIFATRQAIAKEEERIARRVVQLNSIVADSDRKTASERLIALRQLSAINQEIANVSLARGISSLDTQDARKNVLLSGDQNARRALAEQTAEVRALQGALAPLTTQLGAAERAATKLGIAKAFLARQASSLIGLFGGPWGVAITGAITLIGYLGIRAQETAQKIENSKRIYEDFIAAQSKAPSGPGVNQAITAQAGSLNKQITDAQKLRKEFEEMIDAEIRADREFAVMQGGGENTDALNQAAEILRVTGNNAERIIEEISRLRDSSIDIQPVTENLDNMARAAAGADISIKNAKRSLDELGKPRGFIAPINPDDFTKSSQEYQRETDRMVEIARIAATGDQIGAKAHKEWLEQLSKGGLVTKDMIVLRYRLLETTEQLTEATKALKKAEAEEILEQEKNRGDQAKAFGDFFSEIREKIQQTQLLAQGLTVAARARELMLEASKKGIDLSEKDAYSLARQEDAANKARDTFEKSRREAESFHERLKRLREEGQGAFLGDLDREVLELARSMKASAADIKAYVEAARTGNFNGVNPEIMDLRSTLILRQGGQAAREVVQQYGMWSQIAPLAAERQRILDTAVQNGVITAMQAKLAYADFLANFGNYQWINQTADAFGTFITEVGMGTGTIDELDKAITNLRQSLQRLMLEELAAKPLRDLIRTGLASFVGGGMPLSLGTIGGTGGGLGGRYDSGGIAGMVGFGPRTKLGAIPIADSGLGPRNFLSILEQGEAVLTRQLTGRTMGVMDGLARMAGGGPGVEIHVHEAPGGDKVGDVRRSPDGSRIDVIMRRQIDDTSANLIASGESRTNKELERRYGLQPKL